MAPPHTMPISPVVSAPAALSDEQVQAVRDAKAGRKKIDVAVGVATFNIWSLGLFAALSGLIMLFSFSLLSLMITAGLGLTAYHEAKGRKMLRELNPRGARHLGYNQLSLGGLIVAYCAWSMVTALFGPSAYAEVIQQNPELGQVLGDSDQLFRTVAALVYGMAILLTVPYQVLVAWFYFSRAKHVTRYVAQTPTWVTQVQRAAA